MATVLITGCSSGFGKVTALEFARRGDTVFATMRDTTKAESLLSEARAAGVEIHVLRLDVTEGSSVEAAITEAVQRGGRPDVLVNNAAIFSVGPIEAHDDNEIHVAFDTNVYGVVRVIRSALPHMREHRSATIVVVGSMAGRVAWPPIGVYCATKGALEALSDALYYELHPFGIRVILVEPGNFATGMPLRAARRFANDSPYARHARTFAPLPSAGRAPGDPWVVARAFVNATKEEQPKRRYVVGQDAEFWCSLHKQLADEDFERVMRTTLGFWD